MLPISCHAFGCFYRKIVDVLRLMGASATLDELVWDAGFARSTVIIHLERLMSERACFKGEKAI